MQNNEELKHSLGSSLFLLGNIIPEDAVYAFQLDYGYKLTEKDVLIVEGITWRYYEPLGSNGSSKEKYPGNIRSTAIGVGYQRFLWKNLHSVILVNPYLMQFSDEDDELIQSGFRLYLHTRIGYRIEFFDNRWYIEPSVGFNYWPVSTNIPADFKEIEDDYTNYNLFDINLHFGFRFW